MRMGINKANNNLKTSILNENPKTSQGPLKWRTQSSFELLKISASMKDRGHIFALIIGEWYEAVGQILFFFQGLVPSPPPPFL